MQACRAAGSAPTISIQADSTYTVLGLVSQGLGVAVASVSYRVVAPVGVTVLPIDNLFAPLYVVHRREDDSAVNAFLESVRAALLTIRFTSLVACEAEA